VLRLLQKKEDFKVVAFMLLNRTDSRLLRGVVAVSEDEAASSPPVRAKPWHPPICEVSPRSWARSTRVIGGMPSTLSTLVCGRCQV
jgi:hypothetical protein